MYTARMWCVEYMERLPWGNTQRKIERVIIQVQRHQTRHHLHTALIKHKTLLYRRCEARVKICFGPAHAE